MQPELKCILNIAGNVYNFKWYYSTSEEPYNIDVVTSDAGFAVKVIDKTLWKIYIFKIYTSYKNDRTPELEVEVTLYPEQ